MCWGSARVLLEFCQDSSGVMLEFFLSSTVAPSKGWIAVGGLAHNTSKAGAWPTTFEMGVCRREGVGAGWDGVCCDFLLVFALRAAVGNVVLNTMKLGCAFRFACYPGLQATASAADPSRF